ncbi:MAG: hypothetical protein NNA21_01270 [Nitrospira sp.]|nr:hypothetical protein [Nitrospira sp.]MCP9461958.1 hypothetical protein [Nitrospira sp.]MCP9473640.1 hypothetical protein [Nitrospira sp.]
MKLGSERAAGFFVPLPPSLVSVLARLDALSLKPGFSLQRELALARALKPYIGEGMSGVMMPLAQETELAGLFMICDFYPEDGQLSLIEQLRDVVTEHVPDEERAWLDPLKHSRMDVFELVSSDSARVTARSLGDGATVHLPGGDFIKNAPPGSGILTRVISQPGEGSSDAIWGGCGLLLSPEDAAALIETVAEWRRELEIETGSFTLGEWREFAKRYGYMLLWAFAQLRLDALVDAVVHIRYRGSDGRPYLYAVALYDHHDRRVFADQLSAMKELEPEQSSRRSAGESAGSGPPPASVWVQRVETGAGMEIVARLTLTSSQLIVECDGPERLDRIKHELAAALGFSLHFRGETVEPPARKLSVADLTTGDPPAVVVTPEEDRALLARFLEKAYLEWADQPHVALGGRTPRHAAESPLMRKTVGALIDEMAAHDPGRRRTGLPAFEYNRLRAHVGLDEAPAE